MVVFSLGRCCSRTSCPRSTLSATSGSSTAPYTGVKPWSGTLWARSFGNTASNGSRWRFQRICPSFTDLCARNYGLDWKEKKQRDSTSYSGKALNQPVNKLKNGYGNGSISFRLAARNRADWTLRSYTV